MCINGSSKKRTEGKEKEIKAELRVKNLGVKKGQNFCSKAFGANALVTIWQVSVFIRICESPYTGM